MAEAVYYADPFIKVSHLKTEAGFDCELSHSAI